MATGMMNAISLRDQHEYKKLTAAVLLDEGISYRKIHDQTGLAISTIGKIKHARIQTSPALLAAIKAQEQSQLSQMGLLSRGIIEQKLLKTLEGSDDMTPTQVIEALKTVFNQRRLLEGEPTAITQVDSANASIIEIRKELDLLKADMGSDNDVLLVQNEDGVYSEQGSE